MSADFGENFSAILSKIFGNILHIAENFAQDGGKIGPKDVGKDFLDTL